MTPCRAAPASWLLMAAAEHLLKTIAQHIAACHSDNVRFDSNNDTENISDFAACHSDNVLLIATMTLKISLTLPNNCSRRQICQSLLSEWVAGSRRQFSDCHTRLAALRVCLYLSCKPPWRLACCPFQTGRPQAGSSPWANLASGPRTAERT